MEPDQKTVAVMQRFRSDTKWMSGYKLRTKLAWRLRYQLIIQFLLSFSNSITIVVPSICLKYLLDFLSSYHNSHQTHVVTMLGLVIPLSQLMGEVVHIQEGNLPVILREKLKDSGIEIFAKALRRSENYVEKLSGSSKMKATHGKVQNMVRNDVGDG